jgi:hypothetical protein
MGRLNFPPLMTNVKADAIIKAVDSLAWIELDYLKHDRVDAATAQFKPMHPRMEATLA